MADETTPAAPAASPTPAPVTPSPTPAPAADTPAATPAAATGNPLVDNARAADPAAPAAAQGADGKPAPAAAPAAPYVPEGLPEALRGATERETIDKLWKAQQEAPKPPATAADYTLELPKELEGVIDPASDKVLPLWRDIAHKQGLSQAQYQAAIVDLYAGMTKAGLIDPSVNIGAEFEALARVPGDKAAKIQDGKARVLASVDQIAGLATRQALSEPEAKALITMLGDRQSVAAIEKLLAMLPAERGVQPGGSPGGGVDLNDPAQRARLMYPNSQPRTAS